MDQQSRVLKYLRVFLTKIQQHLSIRLAFTLPFFIQTFIITSILGFILYRGSVSVADQALVVLNGRVLDQVQRQLAQELMKPIQFNQLNWNSFQSGFLSIGDASEREKYFVSHLKAYDNVAMAYIGLSDGSFYGARRNAKGQFQVVRNNASTGGASNYYDVNEQGEGTTFSEAFKNFDPRKRPWYQTAQKMNQPVLTGVYNHFVFKEPTITAARPLILDNQFIGVLGVDYLLTWLEADLTNFPVGENGAVFITDEQGFLVGTSENVPIFEEAEDGSFKLIKAINSESSLIVDAFSNREQDPVRKISEFKRDGFNYILSEKSFTEYGLDWKIFVVISKEDFVGPINTALVRTAIVMGISIFAYFFVAYYMAKGILRPILKLNQAAAALSQGKFIWVDDGERQDEVGQLIRGFNQMGKELTSLVSDLESQVDARTRELKEKNEILEQLSFVDGLTGIPNRRKFDEVLDFSFTAAMRSKSEIVLLMLDIDKFKAYNDTYGHHEGDLCLKAIAKVLKNQVKRSTDLVARYGGEEFAIILNNTDIHQGVVVASQIIEAVQALKIEHVKSEWGIVTISIGVAVLTPIVGVKMYALIELADQALYEAKNNGRNRYEMLG